MCSHMTMICFQYVSVPCICRCPPFVKLLMFHAVVSILISSLKILHKANNVISYYYKDDFCWFKNIKYTTRVAGFMCVIVLLKANVKINSCTFVCNWDVIK